MRLRHFILYFLALTGCLFVSCSGSSKEDKPDSSTIDVRISIPSSITINLEKPAQTFKVLFEKAPKSSDAIIFKDAVGIAHATPITSVDKSFVTVDCSSVTTFGDYTVLLRRGSVELTLGTTKVIIDDGVQPTAGSTVYGKVECDGKGVSGAVVSDGVEVVTTDSKGVYQLKSAKKYGYVFVSTPSGYDPGAEGTQPLCYIRLSKASNVAERADFTLYKSADQSDYTLLVFGDMHLAGGRNNDLKWFRQFTEDVNKYISDNKGGTIYGITLGDMTWDYYWYSNSFQLSNYLQEVNKDIKNLMIYNTIGNHDHDMNQTGDFETVAPWTQTIAPDYYSFNIGKEHYIVLDDILCKNTGGRDGRDYEIRITDEQLEWMAKDLAHVSKSTPLVITMHAPCNQLKNEAEVKNVLSGYTVNFITGHTHQIFNEQRAVNIMDHNSGAICTDWWWSVYNTNGKLNIGTDGAPAGYQIFKFKGTDASWQFKPTGYSSAYQFRTYDRNQIDLSADKVMSSASEANKNFFNDFAKTWSSSSSANEVYINVWNFADLWKLEVTENGKALATERVPVRDPLHILTTSVKYMKSAAKTTYYTTSVSSHIWKVTASSPTSTLVIKVTDRFGNVYTQTMTRPKSFDVDTYYKELSEY